MQIVQIVKRFGPVGGMEEYVFQLSKELIKLGYEVIVLCEKSFADDATGVSVFEVGFCGKPHWFAHYRFSEKVSKWLRENDSSQRIIHSHERQVCHNITTFHTTPFGHGRRSLFKFLSLRNYFYERLEKRELLSRGVKKIIPVSNSLGAIIKIKHPEASEKMMNAIYPATPFAEHRSSEAEVVDKKDLCIGFIGKEWKRKGLEKVIQIWRALNQQKKIFKLKVAGVAKESISHLFDQGEQGYEILGVISDREPFYNSLDILIHPAKLEAFGMVVVEALSLNVPVLCSTETGAHEVLGNFGNHLPANSSFGEWTEAVQQVLSLNVPEVRFSRGWDQVAQDYCREYQSILELDS